MLSFGLDMVGSTNLTTVELVNQLLFILLMFPVIKDN